MFWGRGTKKGCLCRTPPAFISHPHPCRPPRFLPHRHEDSKAGRRRPAASAGPFLPVLPAPVSACSSSSAYPGSSSCACSACRGRRRSPGGAAAARARAGDMRGGSLRPRPAVPRRKSPGEEIDLPYLLPALHVSVGSFWKASSLFYGFPLSAGAIGARLHAVLEPLFSVHMVCSSLT